MHAQVLRRREGYQLSYNLPYRTYATHVYPRRSVNDSTIILHAHEQGISAVWYGGRRYQKPSRNSQTNGETVGLTEDDSEQPTKYEEEDDEIEPSRPFHDIIAQVEVSLGTAAILTAVPPLPTERTINSYPGLFESTIVLAAACADQSLRLITIPLNPSANASGKVKVVKIQSTYSHQDIISGLAITLTADVLKKEESEPRAGSQSRARDVSDADELADKQQWSLLLASASPTGSGLLLIHQIPLEADGQISKEADDHVPIHRRYIKSPLIGCHLSFNPSPFPAERHSHLLIAATEGSAVKVYQTLPSIELVARRRRGSTATLETTRPTKSSSSSSGKTLINLMPPFLLQSSATLSPKRKRVLDARWVLQGRAVVVLLEDGEWGVWDLEAAGPVSTETSNNLVRGQSNVSGIQGGSLTKFAIRGIVSSSGPTPKKTITNATNRNSSSLAPMTPHTRKIRSNGLFKGQDQNTTDLSHQTQQPQGGISIHPHTSTTKGLSKMYEEAVVFTYGSTHLAIPSIQAYWRAEVGGRGVFDTAGNGRPVILPDLQLANDGYSTAHLLPSTSDNTSVSATTSLPFLVATPLRFSLLVQPLIEDGPQPKASALALRLIGTQSVNHDQALLNSGELDVEGMDRILESMSQNPSAAQSQILNGFGKKSVNFRFDGDEDDEMEMGTPTAKKSSKSKLTIQQPGTEARRLFT